VSILAVAAGATLLTAALACESIIGVGDLQVGACKGGVCDAGEIDGGPADATGEASDCPGSAGPPGVRVGSFCIDRTEVTFGQYRAFLAAKGGDTSGQASECAFNSTYAPAADGPDDLPVTGVNWCDAVAYCKWAGKRLCGRIDPSNGTTLSASELIDVTKNQWLNACTGGGRTTFPYGSSFQPVCNTYELEAGATKPVGSQPGCVGGYPGVFDMIGNVWEWIDAVCIPGDAGSGSDFCQLRGGSYKPASFLDASVTCRTGAQTARRALINDLGFRCCAP
jgi:formylglycine-generating enzyme required for sulfatase activity